MVLSSQLAWGCTQILEMYDEDLLPTEGNRSRPMTEVITISLDLAKHFIQIHRVYGLAEVAIRRQLSRSQVTPIFRQLAS